MAGRGHRAFGFGYLQLLKSQELGVGSYGSVCKARGDKLLCAAKIIHATLVRPNAHERVEPRNEHRLPFSRFMQECEFMKAIKHPNIVQFLGTYEDPQTGLPVLLMELLDDSLTHFLESLEDAVPYHIQVNFCHDIILAISYLHSNGITHRDLSSNNVLLHGNVIAKVTDFGMAQLSHSFTDRAGSLTLCPGADAYMPPEATKGNPEYTEKIDCFSFGVIIVQILTKKFPKPSDRLKEVRTIDPQFPSGTVKVQVSEVERRQNHIRDIHPNNPLLLIALDCLNDGEIERPSSQELCDRVVVLKTTDKYRESERSIAEREERLTKELEQHIREIDELKGKHASEIETLVAQHATEIEELKEKHGIETIRLKDEYAAEINGLKIEHTEKLQGKDQTISTKQEEAIQLRKEKQQLAEQLQAKDAELEIKTQDIYSKRRKIYDLDQLLKQSRELEQHQAIEISELHQNNEQQIEERDKTIKAVQEENQKLRKAYRKQINERYVIIAAGQLENQRQRETMEKITLEHSLLIKERDNTVAARQLENQRLREEMEKIMLKHSLQIKERDDTIAARQSENKYLREGMEKLTVEHNQQIEERDDMVAARQLENQCLREEMEKFKLEYDQQIKERDDTIAARQLENLHLREEMEELKVEHKQQIKARDDTIAAKEQEKHWLRQDYDQQVEERDDMIAARQEEIHRLKEQHAKQVQDLKEMKIRHHQLLILSQYPIDHPDDIPDYKSQKLELSTFLQQRLKERDTWYLIDARWMNKWMKYVGYDEWDQSSAGQDSANPGPVDNSSLFKDRETENLREGLLEEVDFSLLPEVAWSKLTSWYGVTQDSRPIARRVVEHGLQMKFCKVEVYLLDLKLCLHPYVDQTQTKQFSRLTTVADLEAAMREEFSIPTEKECRVWHHNYMPDIYDHELLSTPSQTLQHAGLYSGQLIILETKNEDGSWSRQSQPRSRFSTLDPPKRPQSSKISRQYSVV